MTKLSKEEPPTEDVLKKRRVCREIAKAAPLAVRWTKQSIYSALDWDPRKAARYEAHVQSRTAETQDFREGVSALLGRRDPEFKGK